MHIYRHCRTPPSRLRALGIQVHWNRTRTRRGPQARSWSTQGRTLSNTPRISEEGGAIAAHRNAPALPRSALFLRSSIHGPATVVLGLGPEIESRLVQSHHAEASRTRQRGRAGGRCAPSQTVQMTFRCASSMDRQETAGRSTSYMPMWSSNTARWLNSETHEFVPFLCEGAY